MAGICARTDIECRVFKAPANEVARGVLELDFVVPGRRLSHLRCANAVGDSLWKYVNMRRLFLFIEVWIFHGTQWMVFESNDQRLWQRVRETVIEFLRTQWRQGELFGASEEEAFFVRCAPGRWPTTTSTTAA